MAAERGKKGTAADAVITGGEHWLKRCWGYLQEHASSDLAAWQTSLLGRRKLTHPAEVTKMRQPVRANPRATWYR